MQLGVKLLGGFQVYQHAGRPFTLPTRKAQALLAYLALRPGLRHSRDKLASLLWSERGEQQARHSLRQTLLAIRKSLPDKVVSLIISEGGMLALDASVKVDAVQFEKLSREESAEALEQAASLYDGQLLEGLSLNEEPFEDWLFVERERLHALCIEVLSKLLRIHVDGNEVEPAIPTAIRLLSHDPLQEGVHRTLMKLYAKQGRREAALRQYQICAHVLERELGMSPEQETRDTYAEILRGGRSPEEEAAGSDRDPDLRCVLLVEDDGVTRALVEGFLQEAGYHVVQAADGADALLQLGRDRFDLVLLDMKMPTIDGMKLLQIMNEKGIGTPTICLTALTGDHIELKGLRLGAVDFIRKPVTREVLLMRVRNALRSVDSAAM